jgi:type VI secretion system protein ImpJ
MPTKNKVVWSDGMFLRPQHFQQQVRYTESYIEQRCGALRSFPWGFTELTVDQPLLALGKLSLTAARGVFPDGTPVNIPDDDAPPPPLDVPENTHDATVYLGLPARRAGAVEVDLGADAEPLARYRQREEDVHDAHPEGSGVAPLQVGSLRTRLLLESDPREEYACMGVARIVDARADKQILLDEEFLPPVLDCHASPRLAGYLNELQGLLHHRAEALAGRVSTAGHGGVAEWGDFLLLQAVNRYEPLMAHLSVLQNLHPETFFGTAVTIAGELATFTAPDKRAPTFPVYRHEDLQGTFAPVMGELRQSLSMVLESRAVSIPLQEHRYGMHVATIADRSLIGQATFVLAIHADVPTEDLRKRFPPLVKIGSVEKIRELVNRQLPGIALRPMAVAPRQLPFHAGFVYFELDRNSEHWQVLKDSGGFALHVGGDFPGLTMQFWAIKD